MAETNDVSWQLMKSPKELASWNFPLSDILDSYFNSLPEACKIQYGEAAVVIQNSVNAYVRRVEDLYDETRSLNHKIINNESAEDKMITSIGRIKSKKHKTGFDNFRIHEFDKEIGKNINLKLDEEKTTKFLHHCFSQLENSHAKLAMELVDIVGETIGKKYDFRSKRLRIMASPKFDSEIHNDQHVLKPIPFQDGIPDKIIKSRKEFQLPCHINLLKQIVKKPKRTMKKKNHIRQWYAVSSAHKSYPISDTSQIIKCTNTSEDSLLKSELAAMKEEVSNESHRSYDDALSINQEPGNFTPVMESPSDTMNIGQCDLRMHTNSNSFESLSNTTNFISPTTYTPLALSSYSNKTSLFSPSTSKFVCLKSKNKNKILSTNWKYKNKFGNYIKDKIKEIYEELDLHTDEDQKVAKWHAEIKPRLIAAEQKPPFRIFEYESRILRKLETSDRKVQFDDIIRQEPPCEVARYFSATLQLASTNNLDINICKNLEKSIELILLD